MRADCRLPLKFMQATSSPEVGKTVGYARGLDGTIRRSRACSIGQ